MDWIPILSLFVNVAVGIFVGSTRERLKHIETKLDAYTETVQEMQLECVRRRECHPMA